MAGTKRVKMLLNSFGKQWSLSKQAHEDTDFYSQRADEYRRLLCTTPQIITETILSGLEDRTIIHLTTLEHCRKSIGAALAATCLWENIGGLRFHSATSQHFPQGIQNADLNGIEENGIARWMAENEQPSLIIADVPIHPRFDDSFDRAIGFHTKTMAAAALTGPRTTVGMVLFLNKVSATGHPLYFDHFDSDVLPLLASIVSVSLVR